VRFTVKVSGVKQPGRLPKCSDNGRTSLVSAYPLKYPVTFRAAATSAGEEATWGHLHVRARWIAKIYDAPKYQILIFLYRRAPVRRISFDK